MSCRRIIKWLAKYIIHNSDQLKDAKRFSSADYENEFIKSEYSSKMHRLALDIRKFEIELYWKRASYFWTLIGATFAGYAAVSMSDKMSITDRQDMQVLLACLWFVLSFGWCCANKGSKQWQENWENHVDLLENSACGKLYKVILKRPKVMMGFERKYLIELFTGPSEYSVSRINQLISVFVTIIWGYLMWFSLDLFSFELQVRYRYILLVILTMACCLSFNHLGRTSFGKHNPECFVRSTTIKDD